MNIKEKTYPWDKWLNGGRHELKRGIHFPERITAKNFRTQCYLKGKAKKINVSVLVPDEDTVILQAILPGRNALTLAEQRELLPTEIDDRKLIEKYQNDLELAEHILEKLKGGEEIVLTKYKDFDVSPDKVVQAIFRAAARQDIDVSEWDYKIKGNKVTLFVNKVSNNIVKWVDKLTKIPDEEVMRPLVEYKILFKDPTGYVIEQSVKRCSFCGMPISKHKEELVLIDEQILNLPFLHKKAKLSDFGQYSATSSVEKIILEWPKDFFGSNKVFAEQICEEALSRGIDISKWYFDVDTDKKKLIILCGSLAEKKRENDIYWEYIKLFKKRKNLPPPKQLVDEWLEKLLIDKRIDLYKGIDYICSKDTLMQALTEGANYKDMKISTYLEEGKVADSEITGVTISLRKGMIAKMEFKSKDDWLESNIGRPVEQPFEEKKKENKQQEVDPILLIENKKSALLSLELELKSGEIDKEFYELAKSDLEFQIGELNSEIEVRRLK